MTGSTEAEWRFTIAMEDAKAKHGVRKWLTYAKTPSALAGQSQAAHARAGDRLLDIDARSASGRTKCLFTIDADYKHAGKDYTVRFAETPIVAGAKGEPDPSPIIKEIERSDNGRTASFVFDIADLANWQVAAAIKAIGSPIVRVPFAFNFNDARLGFPGWMMPDPDDPMLQKANSAGSKMWHGGPHPPINSFLVIPTGP